MEDIAFFTKAFFLLGIERFLYGYWYTFPSHFKRSVREGYFGSKIKAEPLYWKSAMTMGTYIKVFQFSVILVDLFSRCEMTHISKIHNSGIASLWESSESIMTIMVGLVLLGIGQGLNYSVFRALGGIGVYYGHEFGYTVPRVSCFPYNTGISDPQYWGVVSCIWGIYVTTGANSYLVPGLETFWYLMSMKVLENPRGRTVARNLGWEDIKSS